MARCLSKQPSLLFLLLVIPSLPCTCVPRVRHTVLLVLAPLFAVVSLVSVLHTLVLL